MYRFGIKLVVHLNNKEFILTNNSTISLPRVESSNVFESVLFKIVRILVLHLRIGLYDTVLILLGIYNTRWENTWLSDPGLN